jgi:REP element-mobilizing transposase RayT
MCTVVGRSADAFLDVLVDFAQPAPRLVDRPCTNMTLARQIIPGRFYLLTRRCTQRQFWLRPDAETRQTWLYCLGVAAERCRIDIVFTTVLSNHHHTIVFDRFATISEFTEHLHKLVARAMNALRGRWENLWASEQASLVHLVDPADVMAKLVYAATNPVKDHLVERVHHWPGVNAFSDFVNDRTVRVTRPRHFFRPDGPLPSAASLRFVVPAELSDAATVRAALRDAVHAREQELIAERRRTGRRVLGRRAVLRQDCDARPTSVEPRRGLDPRVAARSKWARIGALCGLRAYRDAYRDARKALLAGTPAVFPLGTYWLRRFANVQVVVDPAAPRPPPAIIN